MEVGQGQNWGSSAKGKEKYRCHIFMILLFVYFYLFFYTFSEHIPVSLLISYSIIFVQCRFTESVAFDGHVLRAG
jgi:hypothetical protein